MRQASVNPRSRAVVDSFGEDIIDALESLRAREQLAIIMRYGLARQEPRTYKDIAGALGISIARAQNIERSGLIKLRRLRENRSAPGGSVRH